MKVAEHCGAAKRKPPTWATSGQEETLPAPGIICQDALQHRIGKLAHYPDLRSQRHTKHTHPDFLDDCTKYLVLLTAPLIQLAFLAVGSRQTVEYELDLLGI